MSANILPARAYVGGVGDTGPTSAAVIARLASSQRRIMFLFAAFIGPSLPVRQYHFTAEMPSQTR